MKTHRKDIKPEFITLQGKVVITLHAEIGFLLEALICLIYYVSIQFLLKWNRQYFGAKLKTA